MSTPQSLPRLPCVACGGECPADVVETARVRCNVRAFAEQRFEVWRCPHCRSIHAREPVELSRYYAAYPFHALPDDLRVRLVYGNQLARLRRAGLRSSDAILDYGCGSGEFVRYLKARAYEQTFGFDAYNPAYDSVAQLDRQFDCVIAQDVLEHVESPSTLLDQLASLTRPGGILCIGTPNADAIHLDRPEEFVHTLHVPYHRHILARGALSALVESRGFELRSFYGTMYTNTPYLGLNEAFYRYYAALNDDTLDAILGPVQLKRMLRRLPETLFWAFFGAAFSRGTDCTYIFERSAARLPP